MSYGGGQWGGQGGPGGYTAVPAGYPPGFSNGAQPPPHGQYPGQHGAAPPPPPPPTQSGGLLPAGTMQGGGWDDHSRGRRDDGRRDRGRRSRSRSRDRGRRSRSRSRSRSRTRRTGNGSHDRSHDRSRERSRDHSRDRSMDTNRDRDRREPRDDRRWERDARGGRDRDRGARDDGRGHDGWRDGGRRVRPRFGSFDGHDNRGRGFGHGRGNGVGEPTTTLMMRSMPSGCTDLQVSEALAAFGPRDIRLVYHRDSGEFRGFAFIEFPSVEMASAVINHFTGSAGIQDNGPVLTVGGYPVTLLYGESRGGPRPHAPRMDWLCGKCATQNFARRGLCFQCNAPKDATCTEVSSDVRVPPPMEDGAPQATLVVRGLGPQTSEVGLMAVFRDFAPVVEARVVRDRATSVSRGFGFVEFQSVEMATHALQQVRGQRTPLTVEGHPVRVAFARSELRRGTGVPGGAGSLPPSVPAWAAAAAAAFQAPAAQKKASAPPDMSRLNARLPAKEWPDSFEKSGASFVFDSGTGFYYDQSTNFYYDPSAKLYLSGKTHKYYRHNDASSSFDEFSPPEPSTPAPTRDAVKAFADSLATQAAAQTPQAAASGAGAGHTAPPAAELANQLLRGLAGVGTGAAAPPGVVIGAGRGRGRPPSRPRKAPKAKAAAVNPALASTMSMWGQRQRELTGGEPGEVAVPSSSAAQQVQPTANRTAASESTALVSAPASAPTAVAAASPPVQPKAPVCMVCRRKFKTLEVLKLHCEKSDLHKKNLEAAAKKKAQEAASAGLYRDRAAERRKLFKQPAKLKRKPPLRGANAVVAERVALKKEEAVAKAAAAAPLDGTNVGNKMLQKMGWGGRGLGKNEQGITAPIDAVETLGGQASHVKTGVGATGNAPPINPNDSYRVKVQKTLAGRYGASGGGAAPSADEDDGWGGMRHKTSFSM